MRATFKTHNDGTVMRQLDVEAARAVFASIVFAAKFNQSLDSLAKVAQEGLLLRDVPKNGGDAVCQ